MSAFRARTLAKDAMTKIRLLSLPTLLALALMAAGCGSSAKQSAADRYAAQAEQEAKNRKPVAAPTAPVAEKVTPSSGEADLATKPKVPKGQGAAPTKLVVQDLIEGKGKAAKTGDQLTVQYVGVLFKNGKQFDTSWGKGKQPYQFALGSGGVIQGWEQGLLGMKEGGRRKLIIPADLAYGAQGSGSIGPNEPLIFDIDLKKVG
jgi:peptidylprolyl isomerase